MSDQDQNEEIDEVPEDVAALQSHAVELKKDLTRLRDSKRRQIDQARANHLTISDVVSDVYDELIAMQTQMIELCTLTGTSADVAAQYSNAIADHVGFGDEDEEDESDESDESDDDEEGSFLLKVDADMLSSVIIKTGASIVDAKDGKDVDWEDVLKDLERARELVSRIEEKPEPVEH